MFLLQELATFKRVEDRFLPLASTASVSDGSQPPHRTKDSVNIAIAGSVSGLAVLLAACIAAVVQCKRARDPPSTIDTVSVLAANSSATTAVVVAGSQAQAGAHVAAQRRSEIHSSDPMAIDSTVGSMMGGMSAACTSSGAWVPRAAPPSTVTGGTAHPRSRANYVHEQLDCFGPMHRVMTHFEFLGRLERRVGGVLHHELHACALRKSEDEHSFKPCGDCLRLAVGVPSWQHTLSEITSQLQARAGSHKCSCMQVHR